MIQATCIKKFRNKHNQIYGYRLQDTSGQITDVKPDSLKSAIKNNQIYITNLVLTSDSRLIDTSQSTIKQHKVDVNMFLNKAKLLGLKLKEIPTECGNYCYITSKNETDHTIFIPDNIIELSENTYILGEPGPTQYIRNLRGKIKVIGGSKLEQTGHMFSGFKADSLDLSLFDTSNVTNMEGMFENCRAQSINLASFNTSNVNDMNYMFYKCQAQSLDLSSFDTSNVTKMYAMFFGYSGQSLNLSSFNTSSVINMDGMFSHCKMKSLDLSSFDTSNVVFMCGMFSWCEIQSLNISSFNIGQGTNMADMFSRCKIQSINYKDPKLLEAYEERSE